jgi:para-nitrobenzyl esterase
MLPLCTLISFALLGCAMTPAPEQPGLPPGAVRTEQGAMQGTLEGSTWVYKGIPYAAPPVNELRWRPPVAAPMWSGVRSTIAFGPDCPQRGNDGSIVGDEDCLTLNVWTPATPAAGPHPVIVFIHGGAFFAGGSSRPFYDGRTLSELGPVVVVTLNYRLGALGFMAHAALSAESENHGSGNYGLMDQAAALRWVQQNIAAFGGDKSRVLLVGQSAGAYSVCAHLVSPGSRGLFSRAMMLSGACSAMPLAVAEQGGANVAQRLGCDRAADGVAACLRGKSFAEIVEVPLNDRRAGSGVIGPIVDGSVLQDVPARLLASSNRVPVVVSTTRDEFTNQLGQYGGTRPVSSAEDYQEFVRGMFPARADELLAHYVPNPDAPNEPLIALLGDWYFTCPSRTAARQLARSGAPVWRGLFTHDFEAGPLHRLRAAHGFDLLFGFGNLGPQSAFASESERTLARTLPQLWTRFAATGSPSGDAGSTWEPYDAARDNYVAVDEPFSVGAGIRTASCDLLER